LTLEQKLPRPAGLFFCLKNFNSQEYNSNYVINRLLILLIQTKMTKLLKISVIAGMLLTASLVSLSHASAQVNPTCGPNGCVKYVPVDVPVQVPVYNKVVVPVPVPIPTVTIPVYNYRQVPCPITIKEYVPVPYCADCNGLPTGGTVGGNIGGNIDGGANLPGPL
jgi:hypothetical protein